MSTTPIKTVEFYFDFSSPYSYLAATQLPDLAARTGAKIEYRPFVLMAVFKATTNDRPAKVPAKGTYMLKDIERWAEFYGVRFKFSSHFPANTIKAMRLVLVADEDPPRTGGVRVLPPVIGERLLPDDAALREVDA